MMVVWILSSVCNIRWNNLISWEIKNHRPWSTCPPPPSDHSSVPPSSATLYPHSKSVSTPFRRPTRSPTHHSPTQNCSRWPWANGNLRTHQARPPSWWVRSRGRRAGKHPFSSWGEGQRRDARRWQRCRAMKPSKDGSWSWRLCRRLRIFHGPRRIVGCDC